MASVAKEVDSREQNINSNFFGYVALPVRASIRSLYLPMLVVFGG